MTQGEFAVQLVRGLNLQSHLPAAPLMKDYAEVLERIGISPLDGWNVRAALREEDEIVIFSKLSGKERSLYGHGVEFCARTVDRINSSWKEQYSMDGRWSSLDEILADQRFFQQAMPRCPFGDPYRLSRGDHAVKRHRHIQKYLTLSRAAQ